MSTREQILQILEPIASNMGLDLEDVEIKSAGKHSIVQVSIDKDGGINLDEVAQISNQISEALDAKDVLGEKPYTLEVGSPGIDRALTLPRHWRRNIGRLVKINFGSNSEIGRIIESDEEKVSLEVKGKTRSINFDKIDKAFIQVEFNPKKSSK
ncbi:ribosome maturation factor RimP [Actinomycetes bacterium]|nr:ribosome maturation factor RimP [Actinomycetes bacterium]